MQQQFASILCQCDQALQAHANGRPETREGGAVRDAAASDKRSSFRGTPMSDAAAQAHSGDSGRTVIERDVRLAASRLWRMQRSYFEQQGLAMWGGGRSSRSVVPSHITNTAFLAHAFARVALASLIPVGMFSDMNSLTLVGMWLQTIRRLWAYSSRLKPFGAFQ